jgi:hypothetical protein
MHESLLEASQQIPRHKAQLHRMMLIPILITLAVAIIFTPLPG